MVRVALDEDHPSFVAGVLAKIVDLEAHLVLRPLYSGAEVLIGRAVQRGAEQDAAVIEPVADRKHGDAAPAVVSEPAHAAGADQPPALGLFPQLHLLIVDRRIKPWLRAGRRV